MWDERQNTSAYFEKKNSYLAIQKCFAHLVFYQKCMAFIFYQKCLSFYNISHIHAKQEEKEGTRSLLCIQVNLCLELVIEKQ